MATTMSRIPEKNKRNINPIIIYSIAVKFWSRYKKKDLEYYIGI